MCEAGYAFERDDLDCEWGMPAAEDDRLESPVVVNGNSAVGLGVLSAGIGLVAMYPITPATS